MIVVVAGMLRSGSTFSFNIVKDLLSQKGSVNFAFASSIDAAAFSQASDQHLLLKTHTPDEYILEKIKNGSVTCICTVRRPEDAIASCMRSFGFSLEQGIDAVKTWLEWYVLVVNHVLTIDYQNIDQQPRLAIKSILEYLKLGDIPLSPESLAIKYDKRDLKIRYDALLSSTETVDVGFSYYDRETFFHRRHISSLVSQPAEVELSPSQLNRIQNSLREVTSMNGLPDLLRC